MAKKEQKKPSKKPQTKKAVKANKAGAKGKKTAVPAKKTASQAKKPAVRGIKAAAPEKTTAPQPAEVKKFFSIAEFADMTYLTEYGVMQWLKQGKLKGQQNEKGDWQVDASNLEVPNVKRLVR
jgi:ABC-type phosphate transport system substrate-binding protein